jgi:prepilin-type N-terminal cleavage/methylation domain-containing protein/prepilin-type processing-associated H-X9-DG protein
MKFTRPRLQGRNGFTLGEVLVVMAVIAVLVALLLPAISAARESARRISCCNNLKQIGLALQNHASARNALPVGARSSEFLAGISWWVDVAPFLEETAIYCKLDRKGSSAGMILFNAQNAAAVDKLIINAMYCPSSPFEPLRNVGTIQVMMPSYVGISGASSHDAFVESRVSSCCLPKNKGEISGGGLLVPNRAIRLRQIDDGLSNTLVVGECSDYAWNSQGTALRIDGGYPNGWLTGTSVLGTPPHYHPSELAPPSWNITTIRYAPNMRDYDRDGIDNNRGANNPLVSPHPGGVHGLFADGSVRLISEEVELIVLKSWATRNDGNIVNADK